MVDTDTIANIIERETLHITTQPNYAGGLELYAKDSQIESLGIEMVRSVGNSIFDEGYFIAGMRQHLDRDRPCVEVWFDEVDGDQRAEDDGAITVRVHNVLHDATGFDTNEVESYIERYIDNGSDRVRSVKITKGYNNSPLYVELEDTMMDLHTVKHLVREAVHLFSNKVDGVDVGATIRDGNLRIQH